MSNAASASEPDTSSQMRIMATYPQRALPEGLRCLVPGWSTCVAKLPPPRLPVPRPCLCLAPIGGGQVRRQRMHQMVRSVCNTTAGHSAGPASCTASAL